MSGSVTDDHTKSPHGMLSDGLVTLRALEVADLEAMYAWENDTSLWHLGDHTTPFSRAAISDFILSASHDIYTSKQLRLIIEVQGQAIGAIDLFDFSPLHRRACVGILIYDPRHRGRGYSTRALRILVEYCFGLLQMRQLYMYISLTNVVSMTMSRSVGFTPSGTLRRWLNDGSDVAIMQLFAKGC